MKTLWRSIINIFFFVKKLKKSKKKLKLKDVFFEEDHVFLVMDYMSYNLQALIKNHFQSITTDDIKNIMSQILKGVNILHKSWIIHRVYFFSQFYFFEQSF